MNRIHSGLGGGILLLLAACGSSDQLPTGQTPPLANGQVLTTDATIRYLNLEGGCWAVETAAGRRYEPINLGPAFRTDGMKVRVVLRDAPDRGSLCQMGPLVTIDSISNP